MGIPGFGASTAAVRWAAAMPGRPVQAFALPLLIKMARPTPWRRCRRSRATGAATARLVVNTPPMGPLRSDTTSARSRPPAFLMPQCRPAARKPRGAVMPRESVWLMATCASNDDRRLGIGGGRGQAGLFRKSQHQVHRLDRVPGGLFHQIIEGRDGHEPACSLIGVDTDV